VNGAAEADVAVVGYGPVGQLLAILLGRCGWRVHVLERWPEPYPLPRAVHLDHEVARLLQGAGVMAELASSVEAAALYEWRNAAGDVLLRIGRDAEHSLSGWPESLMFHQPELERILDARARACAGVRVERGFEVHDLREDASGVELEARSARGEARRVRARFAVGCDGAQSFVRGRLGAVWSDLGFRFDWLVVDVRPKEPRPWDPLNWQLCDPARPTTLVSGGPGRRRFEFMRLPDETLEGLNDEATAWRLLAGWGVEPGNATLERHAVYTFGARWADVWRRGRLLLAGDAAHLMPPFAGQGMCSGLRDAANLAWKLDLVLAGRASESLLDTYTSERLPHARAIIELSVALGRVICVPDPEEAAARDRRMIAEARERKSPVPAQLPPLGPGLLAAGSPAAGQLFVQDRVRAGGAMGLFDDVVGRGFVLVSPHGDPAARLEPTLADFFASLAGVSAHVGPGGPVADLDDGYARWFASHGVAVALQRPDGSVFGTAPSLDGTGALVASLRSQLAGVRERRPSPPPTAS
jgi:2-polyprenyl-6-methoxyphenol hydroxylase-like FAD-dependent oxidoreductase